MKQLKGTCSYNLPKALKGENGEIAVLMKDGTLVFYYYHNKLPQLTGLNSSFSSVGQKSNVSLTRLTARYQQAASFLDALRERTHFLSHSAYWEN